MLPVEEGKSYGETYNNPCPDCERRECVCDEIPDGQIQCEDGAPFGFTPDKFNE